MATIFGATLMGYVPGHKISDAVPADERIPDFQLPKPGESQEEYENTYIGPMAVYEVGASQSDIAKAKAALPQTPPPGFVELAQSVGDSDDATGGEAAAQPETGSTQSDSSRPQPYWVTAAFADPIPMGDPSSFAKSSLTQALNQMEQDSADTDGAAS